MAREAVAIVSQLGDETTHGTGVAADKRLPGMSLFLNPQLQTQFSRANGFNIDTVATIVKKWTSGSYRGPVTYGEIIYPLSGLYGGSVGTVASGAYPWTFSPNASTSDAFKSFTFQAGDSAAAMEAVYGIFRSMQMTWNRNELQVSGDLAAQFTDNSATLDASPTLVENIPCAAGDVDVYIDSTFAGIGVTKIVKPYEVTINVSSKLDLQWVLNTSFPSFAEAFGTAYEVTVTVRCENDSQARSLYSAMISEALGTRFLRIKCAGLTIGGAETYLLQGDFALKLQNANPEDDMEGVYGWTFEFKGVYNADMGRSHSWLVKNTVALL